jgi:DNA-binding transcriptional regulator/RsmH inhibitor MraZ
LEAAQIQKEIRYIGMGDFFDMWNPESNDEFVAALSNRASIGAERVTQNV